MEFGGDRPKDPPKSTVDGTLSAYKSTLGLEAVVAATGIFQRELCSYNTIQSKTSGA